MLVVAGAIAAGKRYRVQHPPGRIETLTTSSRSLTCLAVGGDGLWIATGAGSGEVSLWDRQRGRLAPIRSSSSLPISSLRFTTDQFLIAGGLGKRLQVWSLKEFDALDIPLFPAPITVVAVHPRRPEIVIGLQNGKLAVLDSVSGEIDEDDAGHVGWAKVIEFHPAGSWFVTGGTDGKLIVRDGKSHARTKTWPGHATDVSSLSISADGITLASADWSGIVKLWRMPDGELVRELSHPDGVSSTVIHGSRLVTASWDGVVRIWSVHDGREIGRVATGQPISAMSLAANGRHAVTVSPANTLRIWQLP
jgi:WD40 repeat protein